MRIRAVAEAAPAALLASCIVPLFFFSAAAGAVTISTLFNTGVNGSGVALPDSWIPDPHYQMITVPGGANTATRVIHVPGGFPADNYFDPSSTTYTGSRWILAVNPSAQPDEDGMPGGNYTFRTTFDLTGLDPSTARIEGMWSADNEGVDILINDLSTGFTSPAGGFATDFVPFLITSGFLAGLNTLDFVVYNTPVGGNNPVGLRVDMEGTANVVPLPAGRLAAALGVRRIRGARAPARRRGGRRDGGLSRLQEKDLPGRTRRHGQAV